MNSTKRLLEVSNLTKSYGELTILEDFKFSIKKNEIVTIIGPSGSGKSTFLRTLNYLEPVEKGNMYFKNKTIKMDKVTNKEKLAIRKNINMIFQHYNLFKNKTALENITESLVIVHKKSEKEANKIGMEMLKTVNLENKANQYPHQLSGGQKQRIGIARALAINPEIVLFDEPTSSLDPELVGEVIETIKLMAKEDSTMIIVTHEMQLAREISDRIIFMDHGKIVSEGTPDEMFKKTSNERLSRFLSRIAI
ncbi:MAG: amino acid ABC transporter ATP-binding protein [Bacillota bacterium]|nr:amino acid ABC transporter ATP-binding protein [Bacillota bacterium]